MNVRFDPSGPLRGRVRVPSDKSISHRAAIIAAMGFAPVRVRNYLNAEDTNSTLNAVRALGANVDRRDGELVIRGVGLHGARPPVGAIDVGNAGTLMRLLPGWLAGHDGVSFEVDGDASIRRRPVDRIAEPLRLMGAEVNAREGRFPPFIVHGAALTGVEYELPVASAQVKSCTLLAGLATDSTTVVETVPSRDHTERMLLAAGASVSREPGPGGVLRTAVGGADRLQLSDIDVPGDVSSAAFLIAAGMLVGRSEIVLEGVGTNWTRAGILRILERMGANVTVDIEQVGSLAPSEPAGDIEVRASRLRGTIIEAEEVPLAIDELPLVALMGCFAEGETIVRGAAELRIKESDRIATVVDGLSGLGAEIEAASDGFWVLGGGGLRGGSIDAHGDHRLALLGAVAGLASREGVEVVGMEAAAVSYPGFGDDVAALIG